jgi:hypothetical protein
MTMLDLPKKVQKEAARVRQVLRHGLHRAAPTERQVYRRIHLEARAGAGPNSDSAPPPRSAYGPELTSLSSVFECLYLDIHSVA